ncbi:acyl-coenzyme A thioesterase 13-like [Contarinia nasturtii]|uniref:acyl-coenzyme A thioesterase 13-like n=1 Tax=Contarinia nasturtii TaxID=265458 RepID=UPI0012D3A18F|nr:acyl-coenzyme A thioesterase 13-like [Contarinia nasturtii]
MSSKKAVDLLKEIVKRFHTSTGFEQVLKHVEITGGDVGHCLAEFVVRKENLNAAGGLHGGFTATVVDNFTTYALVTKNCNPGVTVDLHVSYLKGAREGDTVVIDAKAVKTGKTLAYLECELRNKENGQIIAKGSQTKYVA